MNPDGRVKIEAPCKINVHLKVKSRRSDGYHDLESIFLALAFGDVLEFELTGAAGTCDVLMDWQIPGTFPEMPREHNIVYQAAALFRKRTGFSRGIRVHIEKRIPLGAGLGGGSSDGAAALKALNILTGMTLVRQDLQEMAEDLGSDVPFFLYGGAAWVSGRGERITPIAVPKGITVVLVYPGFPSSTKEAFRLLDAVRVAEGYQDAEEPPRSGGLSEPPEKWAYRNDFLPVFLSAGTPESAEAYRSTLQRLAEAGAAFTGLSGSGSACFGIFTDQETAKKAVQGKKDFRVATFPLAHFTKEVVE